MPSEIGTTGSERRAYPRVPLTVDVDLFQFGSADLYHVAVQDISRSGLRVKADGLNLTRDKIILVTLVGPELLRGPECIAQARFVRNTNGGAAFRFVHDDPRTRDCVDAVLASHGLGKAAPGSTATVDDVETQPASRPLAH